MAIREMDALFREPLASESEEERFIVEDSEPRDIAPHGRRRERKIVTAGTAVSVALLVLGCCIAFRGTAHADEEPRDRVSLELTAKERCHTATKGEPCHVDVEWAMTIGIQEHPAWYEATCPSLTPRGGFEEFQACVYKINKTTCPLPCNPAGTIPQRAIDKAQLVQETSDRLHEAPCHVATPGEQCYQSVVEAMKRGILEHPAKYPGLTTKSTFEEFQAALYKDPASTNCPMPCQCHTAVVGEHCYEHVMWAMGEGLHGHPEWYPNLAVTASFEQVQEYLRKDQSHKCPLPCSVVGKTAAAAETATTTKATTPTTTTQTPAPTKTATKTPATTTMPATTTPAAKTTTRTVAKTTTTATEEEKRSEVKEPQHKEAEEEATKEAERLAKKEAEKAATKEAEREAAKEAERKEAERKQAERKEAERKAAKEAEKKAAEKKAADDKKAEEQAEKDRLEAAAEQEEAEKQVAMEKQAQEEADKDALAEEEARLAVEKEAATQKAIEETERQIAQAEEETTKKVKELHESGHHQQPCHTAVDGEDCWKNLMFGMNEGIYGHPEWYPNLTEFSSVEDYQKILHLNKDLKCAKPCPCHTAVVGEDCYENIKWVIREGLNAHPEWYEGLTVRSRFEDVQKRLHEDVDSTCDVPCTPKVWGTPSLFCFSVFRSTGYELDLVRAQVDRSVGIFKCDEFAMLSDQVLDVAKGLKTLIIPPCETVGVSKDGTAANTMIFMQAWGVIWNDARWRAHDWIIKADPDAVILIDRMRTHLAPHTGKNAWMTNCMKYEGPGWPMMFGSLEAFTSKAMETYYAGAEHCKSDLQWQAWGEDLFMGNCLSTLGATSEFDGGLIGDNVCKGANCQDGIAAAYHPYKSADAWFTCYNQAIR